MRATVGACGYAITTADRLGEQRVAVDVLMKRIVVTGGAGRLGRLVVAQLIERGYDVLAVDRVPARDLPCRTLVMELTDAAAVYDVLSGADAAIHLGAVPGPTSQPASTTFQNNVLSTFHIAEAAAALNLKKLVFASSVFTLGWVEDAHRYWPRYVPVDEEHPLTPFEAYGLSKVVGEEICAAASRRKGMPIVSLRIMNVIWPDGYSSWPAIPPTPDNPVRFVMWPYVDGRDAARSCWLALEAHTTGHEAIFIAAADIRFDRPTHELLAAVAPPSLEIRGKLNSRASVISCDKARRLIGYEPQHSWQIETRDPTSAGRESER